MNNFGERTVPAISLWQPWAEAIAKGLKCFETRSWSTPRRGLLAIHAAKRWTKDERRAMASLKARFPECRVLSDEPALGAVLCVVNLIRVYQTQELSFIGLTPLERALGNYQPGRFAWHIEVVNVFEQPIPTVGRQGFWNWQLPEGVSV